MSFLFPLGLLGLIGIPILIIIYIIKNKYTEQVIASTYIWNLSEKFLKRRLPIHRLVGIISLILQILTVLFVSLAVAHPVFSIPNAAEDYCFVLDGSGSMNIVQSGRTRLDIAKGEISSVIKKSREGSAYSLVLAGNSAEKVFEGVTDKENALKLVNEISPLYISSGLSDAAAVAQSFFNANTSAQFYLVTDKSVELTENVKVVNVSDKVDNYAVSELVFSPASLTAEGDVMSYESDAALTLQLYVNGGEEVYDTKKVEVTKGEKSHFTFNLEEGDYQSLTVAIAETDALALDNRSTFYNLQFDERYSALIVSDQPDFLTFAMLSVGNADPLDIIPTEEYKKVAAASEGLALGYSLYIFDGYTPDVLPQDGAVWFFNPKTDVAGSGFTVQDEVEFADAQIPSYSTDSATVVEKLLKNIDEVKTEDIYITKYQKCGTYRRFNTILTIEGNPLIFTGTNAFGNREVVFAFDLHDSNYPLLPDYIVLTTNILEYSFPSVIDNAYFSCGETMEINVLSGCESIRVVSPQGKISYMDTSAASCEYELTEVGSYTIKVSVGGTEKTFSVFSALAEEERIPAATEESFAIVGVAGNKKRPGTYSDILYLFIALAVLCAADWMVYCYEQYQL
ncbi:MAG: VWA domain-containing protein, partial [Clostridia bacterium]|nr:VWA domain-containing protein [Clostridia bacterium]